MQSIGLFDVLKQFTSSSSSSNSNSNSSSLNINENYNSSSSSQLKRDTSLNEFNNNNNNNRNNNRNKQQLSPSQFSSSSPSSSPSSSSQFSLLQSQHLPEKTEEISNYLKHVYVTLPGPMHIRLRMDEILEISYVNGFERGPKNQLAEVEKDGRVKVGDVLIAVNYTPLYKKSFDDIILIIKNQPEPSIQFPKVLTFCSKSKFIEIINESPLQLSMALSMEKKKPQTDGMSYNNSIKFFQDAIRNGEKIDEANLRRFALMGLPDGHNGIRSTIWKVLLGYLPLDTSKWQSHLVTQRKLYETLLVEVTSIPSHNIDALNRSPKVVSSSIDISASSAPSSPLAPPPSNIRSSSFPNSSNSIQFHSVGDHPLHIDGNISTWAKYWSDSLVVDSIQKDVIRTYPDLKFFLEKEGQCQTCLQNILFLYAKLNPGIKYVQGMNELVGTLYYVFANEQNSEEWLKYAEADTFFCFSLMMAEIRDMYIHNMDEASTGISGRIQRFVDTLRWFDQEICDHLINQGIEPSFYCLRWMTTLFSREFDVLDTIRLWDSYLADTNREELITYLCCAMVLEQREQLSKGDFGENLSLLQKYPPTDVSYLLRKANVLRLHDTSENYRMLSSYSNEMDNLKPDYWDTSSKSLIYTNTISPPSSPSPFLSKSPTLSSSPHHVYSSTSSNNINNQQNPIIPISIGDVYKVSSTFSKYVTNGIIEPLFQLDYLNNHQMRVKPMTYCESHQSDNPIANYQQDEIESVDKEHNNNLTNCIPLNYIESHHNQQTNENNVINSYGSEDSD